MAHINTDLVRETTNTTSTGTYTLAGAQFGFRTFLAAPMVTGDTCWYAVRLGADYEIGLGTFTSPNLLARTAILESSNADAAVSWVAGGKDIYIGTPGQFLAMAGGAPDSGILTFVSATQVKFAPCNGDRIKINKVVHAIPSAGITAANTSVFVNNIAGQNLAANTLYYVFAFLNSSVVTINFHTGVTHAPSTTAHNVGVEIMSGGLDGFSLIGMIVTNASSQFSEMGTASWFNRRTKSAGANFTADRPYTSQTPGEINSEIRVPFVTWGNEGVQAMVSGKVFMSATVNHQVDTGISFDSGTEETQLCSSQTPTTGQPWLPLGLTLVKSGLSEGSHYATLFANVGGVGQTATYNGTGTAKTALQIAIRG